MGADRKLHRSAATVIDELTIDTDCIDGSGCASLAGTFNSVTAFAAQRMSTNVMAPKVITAAVDS